ncbi:MAG: hypothetical protein Ctma_1093 [Catillopecten margaritatus gill symbiont]|uniref:NnrS family protein n=1 Tax=Catillopecten margaritatus gill symbiont TaxID=3083288 RepID=A0AAU6PH87_9GAMM
MNLINNTYSTPSFLRLGFRPFFFAAGSIGVIAMLLWIIFYQSILTTDNINPSQWHAHEMIFAYSAVVIVGFLLTASKNWSKVQTLYGKPLLALFMLWIAGRFLPFVNPEYLLYQAIIDSSFLVISTLVIAYPIIKGKNWVNLSIVAKILLLALSHIAYYLGIFGVLENGINLGLYAGFYLIISLLLMMSRRLLPFFIERGIGLDKALKNTKFLDISSLVLFLVFIVAEVFFSSIIADVLAGILFVIHTIRMFNWYNAGIWKRPLLWSIYLAYGFLTLGFGLHAISNFAGLLPHIALHSFAFGIALMTLSMMSRVSLGHTGRNVFEPPKLLNLMFILLVISFVFRVILTSISVEYYHQWILISQLLWVASFTIFTSIYAPMLFKARTDGQFG